MDRQDIKTLFEQLSKSQGFYARVLLLVSEMDTETEERFWSTLEAQHFKDAVDVVLFMEG